MYIHHDPFDWVTVTEKHTCEHHKRQPWDTAWPGCTCSLMVGSRRATPEERKKNIEEHEKEMERRRKHMEDYDRGLLDG